MRLTAYTRRLEECRKRWNRRTVQFVLEAARILSAARKAAKDEGRWGTWIRNEVHMDPSTAYRYFRVARFFRTNRDLNHDLACLSISKIYALSRMEKEHAISLIRSGEANALSDVAFLKLTRRLQPRPVTRDSLSNLVKSLDASLVRLDRLMRRWHHSEQPMPVPIALKVKAKLRSMERTLDRMGRTGAVAM